MLFLLCSPAGAAVIQAGPADDVEGIINGLAPGDELVLADGTYTLGERFSFDITGTPQAPILIRAAEGARPHFHRPDASQNVWDVTARFATLRGLAFSGGSAGLRIQVADHLTIDSCEIYNTADVALRMNDTGQTYERVQILHNHIHDTSGTGEGMYLGCNSNGCRLAHALIAGNHVHHTNGPGVSQGDGIELKEGSYGCVIQDNVIHHTNYPCILTYSTVGNGPPNRIERNVLWACGDHGIQTSADAIVQNNIILEAGGEGIALQPHQSGSPANIEIRHNTIVQASMNAIALRGVSGAVLLANNALYAQNGSAINPVNGDFSQLVVAGNVGLGGVAGGQYPITNGDLTADFVAAHWSGAPPIDLFPRAGGALVDGGDPAQVIADDFNGTDRQGQAHAGAYHYSAAGNPGWTISADFKDPISSEPDPDGGVDGDDGQSDGEDGLDADADGLDAGADGLDADGDGPDAGVDGLNTDADGPDADADSLDAGADGLDAGADDQSDGASVADRDGAISGGCACGGQGDLGPVPLILLLLGAMARAGSRDRRRR